MTTNEFETESGQIPESSTEKPKSLLPLALAVGAAAAIIMTILTLI